MSSDTLNCPVTSVNGQVGDVVIENDIVFESWMGNESPSIINNNPLEEVENLKVQYLDSQQITVSWSDRVSLGSIKNFNIYLNEVLMETKLARQDTIVSHTFSKLLANTTYNVKITTTSNDGEESLGKVLSVKTLGQYSLALNGFDEYLLSSSLQFDRIDMVMRIDYVDPTRWNYILDARNNLVEGHFGILSNGSVHLGTGWNNMIVNGTKKTRVQSGTPTMGSIYRLPSDKLVISLKAEHNVIQSVAFFCQSNMKNFLNGRVYSIKFFLGDNDIAHFDLTNPIEAGVITDTSGNGHTLTRYGGSWELEGDIG